MFAITGTGNKAGILRLGVREICPDPPKSIPDSGGRISHSLRVPKYGEVLVCGSRIHSASSKVEEVGPKKRWPDPVRGVSFFCSSSANLLDFSLNLYTFSHYHHLVLIQDRICRHDTSPDSPVHARQARWPTRSKTTRQSVKKTFARMPNLCLVSD